MASSQLHVKTIGTGTSIVFLHGFLEDHSVWNPIYPDFVNAGFQCILIDLPCHGKTRFDGENCSMKYMADEVFNYLAFKGIENPFVLGHSMGGYVGLVLRRLMKIRLTLVHSNFWTDSEEKKQDRNRVIEVVKQNKSLFLNVAIPNLFAPFNREFRREEINLLLEKAEKIPTAEIAATTAGLRDRLPAYDVMEMDDVTIIQASDDSVIPDEILNDECSKLTRKPVIYRIENCGHMSFIEDPEALINHLKTLVFQ
jgi:pimeloyl-ACP methyl ester carboxylesterase